MYYGCLMLNLECATSKTGINSMNKYILVFVVLVFLVVSLLLRGGEYEGWSKINKLLETSCRNSEGWRDYCSIDFKEIGFSWDNIYSFGGAEQRGVNLLLGTESVEVDQSCVYLAFTRENEGVIAVYEQCIDEESHEIFNDFNEVTLRVEIPIDNYQPLNAICEDYSVSKKSNLHEVPVRYALSCSGVSGKSIPSRQ